MTDAPERIWAFYSEDIGLDYDHASIVAYEEPQAYGQEYIRADIAEAKLAKAREDALKEALDVALGYGAAHCDEDIAEEIRRLMDKTDD